MSRRTACRGVALLALVLTLAIIGAQPAAAADRGHANHFAGFWASFLDSIPGGRAVQNALDGWFHITEKSTTQDKADAGWGIDPNGTVVNGMQPLPTIPTGSGF